MAISLVNMKTTIRFDNAGIGKYVSDIEKKSLQKAGIILRARAMKEIRRAPEGTAAMAGESFRSHPAGGKADSGIKRAIQYGLEPASATVVVGPVFAQELFKKHEEGATVRVKNKRRRKRKIGDVGVIARGSELSAGIRRHYREVVGPAYAKGDPNVKEGVTFGRIRTEKQLARVNRFEEDLFGPEGETMANYPRRPVLENTLENNPDALDEALRAVYGA